MNPNNEDSGGLGGSEVQPDYREVIRIHTLAQRRRRIKGAVLIVVLLALGAAGYFVYDRYFRFGHLIGDLESCAVGFEPDDPGLNASCKESLDGLTRYAPGRCAALTAAIGASKNADHRNLILLALLTGTRAKNKASVPASVKDDPCLRKAILAVYKGTCREEGCAPKGFFVARPPIWGVASYNQARIPWGVHVRLLGQLDMVSVTSSLQTLGERMNALLGPDDPARRKYTQALIDRHMTPALDKTYQALVDGKLASSAGATAASLVIPKGFGEMLAAAAKPGQPLGKKILDHMFQRLIFGDVDSVIFAMHVKLFNTVLKDPAWMKVFAPRLKPLAAESPGRLLHLSRLLDDKHGPTQKAVMPLVESLIDSDDDAILASKDLAILAARSTRLGRAIRLLERRPGHDLMLEDTLKSLAKGGQDVHELIRQILVFRIATGGRRCPAPTSAVRTQEWITPRFSWLFRQFKLKLKRCKFPPRASWAILADKHWPRALQKKMRKTATQWRQETMEQAVSRDSDADTRFFGTVSLTRLPKQKRIFLARMGLRDPAPSVRAMAALVLGYRMRGKRQVGKIAGYLASLRKDRHAVARFAAFSVLTRSNEERHMRPFINDRSAMVVERWRRRVKSFDDDELTRYLRRKDRGPGLVLPEVFLRMTREDPLAVKPDIMSKLTRHPASMVRAELARGLLTPGSPAAYLHQLFKDPSPWVRRRALDIMRISLQDPNRAAAVEEFKDFIPLAAELAADPVFEVRHQATALFASLDDAAFARSLAPFVTHKVCRVKRLALQTIARLNKVEAPDVPCKP